jgi:nicotinate-nucleotide pyrophosphorylase (carboxylating)
MTVHQLFIDDIVRATLKADLGHGHDVTTEALIPADRRGVAVMRARRDCTLAGVRAAVAAFRLAEPALELDVLAQDGTALHAGQDILRIAGPACGILTAERTALNFVMLLSGTATQTRRYVDTVAGTRAAIVCTRKTMPGIGALQKDAVRAGGGRNHRFGLDDGLLVKDNHVALAGGIAAALARARTHAGHMVKVEIEVDTLAQLAEALEHGADAVLLDNMPPAMMKDAVAMTGGRAVLEASGGITHDTVRAVAESGVDMISVGALTHSVTAADIGLDIDL